MSTVLNDAVALLRKRPEIYLGREGLTAHRMAALVLQDAIVLGVDDLRVRTFPEAWTVLSAARDWTRIGPGSELPRSTLFRALIPFDAAGINAVRHEVYLTAYTRDVFVCDPDGVEVLSGAPPSLDLVEKLESNQFHLGFRL